MRIYLPIKSEDLADFYREKKYAPEKVFAPTQSLAQMYGVSELEEMEYAALEISREDAESQSCPIIAALEIVAEQLADSKEQGSGELHGSFSLTWQEVEALYLIPEEEEELEWYDVTEVQLCLAKVSR